MSQPKLKATVNGDLSFEFNDESVGQLNIVRIDENTFHLIESGNSVIVELEAKDVSAKSYQLRIQGESFTVQLADEVDQLVQAMGLSAESSRKVGDIKAPMPGLVLDIQVNAGDVVENGQALLILEAMKMENVLKSPGDGTVEEIKVSKGDAVEKGQLLIRMA